MATLVRPISPVNRERVPLASTLDLSIPAPFPVEELRRAREERNIISEGLDDLFANYDDVEETRVLVHRSDDLAIEQQQQEQEPEPEPEPEPETNQLILDELLPSLAYVQQCCLMTLNNLLSGSLGAHDWLPIVPTRRHSMPSRPEDASFNENSSALFTLLSNLRNMNTSQMSEASSSSADDSVLLNELQRHVITVSHELSPSNAQLAFALTSLLRHANRLSVVDPTLSSSRLNTSISSSTSILAQRSCLDIYDELSRQVLDLQIKRLDRGSEGLECAPTPHGNAEVSLLWSKIDQELELVSDLCRLRNERRPRPYSPESLPPEYDYDEAPDCTISPPEYEYTHNMQIDKEKSNADTTHQFLSTSIVTNEKMRMDLDTITMAIDRLYLVAPQLSNQRVELRKSKVEELERARLGECLPIQKVLLSEKGKEKERKKDKRELERIMDMVRKASSRTLDSQTVMLDGNMRERMERSKQKNDAKRAEFMEQLLSHLDSGRITSQEFQPNLLRNPDALLSLPEFIREGVPKEFQEEIERDPNTLLTLKEMIKESPPRVTAPQGSTSGIKSNRKHRMSLAKRGRSLSAPPLSWLIPSLSRSRGDLSLQSPPYDEAAPKMMKRLIVRYVAEHYENLNQVLVFIGVDEGMIPGVDLEADVLPDVGDPGCGDKLILKCGSNVSVPLGLPVHVAAARVDVRMQGGHYEIKLPVAIRSMRPSTRSYVSGGVDAGDLLSNTTECASSVLDAAQIASMDPTSFICVSCSSTLVDARANGASTKLTYLDLPSEHWEELLEAWMCHSDQKLTDRVVEHSKGFWPRPEQAFIGGSYLLFNKSAIATSNLRVIDAGKDGWMRVQCICNAIVGRCQSRPACDGAESTVYRLAKYAIRPISLTVEPPRVPFSAYILEDMLELVRAHASYRFVILDEEEERPRVMIWLFKPHMRLSYATAASYALPQTGSVQTSKVLFNVLRNGLDTWKSPASSVSSSPVPEYILQKHPGFSQAERLYYPLDVCQRLASLLKESNTSYPMGMRTMTGLLTGWLRKT